MNRRCITYRAIDVYRVYMHRSEHLSFMMSRSMEVHLGSVLTVQYVLSGRPWTAVVEVSLVEQYTYNVYLVYGDILYKKEVGSK